VSNEEISAQLAAIAQKQDDLILLFAGRLEWDAAATAARFSGGEYPYSEFKERDGRIEIHHSYPISANYSPN
jgi:hypothetical protein